MRRLLSLTLMAVLVTSCKLTPTNRPLIGIRESTETEHTEEHNEPSLSETRSDGMTDDADSIVVTPSGMEQQILHRTAYTASYNKETRNPNWVAWTLTDGHTDGPYKRNGLKFEEDTDVPEPRATNMDYTQSGYDRGHMCPSGDCKWSQQTQIESFLYTNCCPQLHSLNSGGWNTLENSCRTWARRYGKVWIACGPIYRGTGQRRIGRSKVVVPDAFFKVVLTKKKSEYMALAFIYENKTQDADMSEYTVTVDEVETITGYDFFPFLPDAIENSVETTSDIDRW